ncbi:MAG: class I SAM-dependent methyltransferase [Acidobacteriota bacterium]
MEDRAPEPTSSLQRDKCPVCSSIQSEQFCRAFDRYYGSPDQTWEIVRCRGCGFGWTYPPLPEGEILGCYPDWYMGDTRRTIEEFKSGKLARSRSWRVEVEKARHVERLVSSGRILDVGCGDGKFLWGMDASRWERVGVERAAEIVSLVSRHFPGVQWISGDIYSGRLPEGSFDAVTFWHVLEHLPRPRRVLQRVAELLRPGGWVVIALPNLESLQASLFRRNWFAFDEVPRHLFHYSPRSLEILLAEAGLQVESHRLYSWNNNFHSLKHSLIHWSEGRCGNRIPYYLLKPLLFGLQALEQSSGRYGMLSTAARRG